MGKTQTLSELANKQSLQTEQSTAKKRFPKPDIFTKFLILEGWTHWLFRLGFASIFFVNAIYATVEPESFISLLENNPIASLLGHAEFLVKIAMVNDLLLSVCIIGGWRKHMVYAWAGTWLLIIAGLKLMNLFFN
jgi:hypothetical protein